jgi:hypothetical protein
MWGGIVGLDEGLMALLQICSYYYIGRFEVSSDVLRGVLTVTFYTGPFSS